MMFMPESTVVDGGFKSLAEARTFADHLVSTCITSRRLVQEVIAEALLQVQDAVERKYCNAVAIPDGWRLTAVREPQEAYYHGYTPE